MLRKGFFLVIAIFLYTNFLFSQTTYLPLNTEDYHLLDRLETLSGRLSDSLFLIDKPESRERAVDFLLAQQENARYRNFSNIDLYNIKRMISENGEWAPDENGGIASRHPWGHAFYKKQPDFIYTHTHNFFLVINPVISVSAATESTSPDSAKRASSPMLSTMFGAEARGWIGKKLGFYFSFTSNHETPPSYVNMWADKKLQALPGAANFSIASPGIYNYVLPEGYIDFAIIKDHINLTAGYGRQFWGDGIETGELSDFSGNMPFLRLITRIWKIDYTNLYVIETPQFNPDNNNQTMHKYATLHRLSFNTFRWLNVGFFEATEFARANTYELNYLNPIILYRAVDRGNGDPDKELLGFDWKIIAAKHLQFYSQFILNEFTSKEFFSNHGYWANKWALQLGGKYFDAFTVKNLDLQAELNIVRPYTYTSYDTLSNYTHYNQPLANPLGSGFRQFIAVARYQPVKNLYLTLKGMIYTQGADSGTTNLGNDIFNSYNSRSLQYGSHVVNGPQNNCALIDFTISYQLAQNLFIDLGGIHRNYSSQASAFPIYNTSGAIYNANNTATYLFFGIRLNAAMRNYDFF